MYLRNGYCIEYDPFNSSVANEFNNFWCEVDKGSTVAVVGFVEGISNTFGVEYDVARNIFGAAVIGVSLILAILLIWWDHDRFAFIDSIRARRNDRKYYRLQQERSSQKRISATTATAAVAAQPEPQDLHPTLRQWVLDVSTQRTPTKELLERAEHILATYPNSLAAAGLQGLLQRLVDEITTSYATDQNYVVS